MTRKFRFFAIQFGKYDTCKINVFARSASQVAGAFSRHFHIAIFVVD